MNRGTKALVIMTVLLTLGGVAAAQETLKDLVEQEGTGWMLGQWKATTDDGQSIVLGYTWAVNGHAIISDFKMGERSSHGMIYFDANEEQVKQFSIDSRGKATKATWASEYGQVKATTKMTDEYGDSTDVVIVYSKVNSTTIGVAVYGLEYGVMSDSPYFEKNFSKVKKP